MPYKCDKCEKEFEAKNEAEKHEKVCKRKYPITIKKIKSKSTAILLAVFLSYWGWIYTWHKNWWKWLVGLLISFLSGWHVLYLFPVIWIWVIIDNILKPKEWYLNYKITYK
jgi:hypothetical protein